MCFTVHSCYPGSFSSVQVCLDIVLISLLYLIVYNEQTNDAMSSIQISMQVDWWCESTGDKNILYTWYLTLFANFLTR